MESLFKTGIENLLRENGFGYTESGGAYIVGEKNLMIVPVLTDDFDSEGKFKRQEPHTGIRFEAMKESLKAEQGYDGIRRIFIYEDRWNSARENTKWKILGSLGRAKSVFARKCLVLSNFAKGAENRVSKEKVGEFLGKYHNYGYVKSTYCIALSCNGGIVAAATFSEPKRFVNSGTTILSYEWTRYASLPEIRVAGGMGKILKYFIGSCRASLDSAGRETAPETDRYTAEAGSLVRNNTGGAARKETIEIMSYSDNESGDGGVYRKLGFREAGEKSPIRYYVDKTDWQRLSARQVSVLMKSGKFREEDYFPISNMGSRKFILQCQ